MANDRAWMVNFRVRDLAAMVQQLRANGITVNVDPTPYPNGRFARLQDSPPGGRRPGPAAPDRRQARMNGPIVTVAASGRSRLEYRP
jgi:hypothetical protein